MKNNLYIVYNSLGNIGLFQFGLVRCQSNAKNQLMNATAHLCSFM